jgi:hypothetical protein
MSEDSDLSFRRVLDPMERISNRSGLRPRAAGVSMVAVGSALVGVAIALGG